MPPKRGKKKESKFVFLHYETQLRCKRLATLQSDRPATTLPSVKDMNALEQALPKAVSLPENILRAQEFLVVLRVENKIGIVPYSDIHLPKTIAEWHDQTDKDRERPWTCSLSHPYVEVPLPDVKKCSTLLKRELRRATRLKQKLFRCLDSGMKALQRATDQEAVVGRLEGDWHKTYLSGDDYWAQQKVSRFPAGCESDFGAEGVPEDTVLVLDGGCPEAKDEVLKALGNGRRVLPKRYNIVVFGLPDKDMRMTSWRPTLAPPGQRVDHVSTALAWLNSLPIKDGKASKKRPSSAPAGRRKGVELPTVLDGIKLALQMKPRRIWVAARGGSLHGAETKAEETRTLLSTNEMVTRGAGIPYIVQKVILWDATDSDKWFWTEVTGTEERVDTIDTKKELGDLGAICKDLKTQKKKVNKAQAKFGKLNDKVPTFLSQLREQLHKQWAIERLLKMDLDECKLATKRSSGNDEANQGQSTGRGVPRLENTENLRKANSSPEPSELGSTRAPSTAALNSERSTSRPDSAMTITESSPAVSRPESAVTRPPSAGQNDHSPSAAGASPSQPESTQSQSAEMSYAPRPPAGERPETAGPRARLSKLHTSSPDAASQPGSRPQSATDRQP